MKKVIFIVASIIVLIIAGFAILGLLFVIALPGETIDQTDKWSSYYTNTVSGYMILPQEAQIKKAIHTNTPIMGEYFEIAFTLPETKQPEVWLNQILKDSMVNINYIKPHWKRSPFLLDCRDDCDNWSVAYDLIRELYLASSGWD